MRQHEFGHRYIETIVARRINDGYTFNFAGKMRRCEECGKEQVHYQGVWIDAPKHFEPKEKKVQEIDPAQLSLF